MISDGQTSEIAWLEGDKQDLILYFVSCPPRIEGFSWIDKSYVEEYDIQGKPCEIIHKIYNELNEVAHPKGIESTLSKWEAKRIIDKHLPPEKKIA